MTLLASSNLRVGLDIGSSSIKMVAVDVGSNKLVACRKSNLLRDGKVDKTMKFHELYDQYFRKAFREVLKDIPYQKASLRVCLSADFNNLFVVKIPEVSNKELKQTIFWELGALLPDTANKYEFDFQILRKDEKKKRLVILVGALLKDNMKAFLPVLKEYVSHVPIMDTDTLANLDLFMSQNDDSEETFGLLQLGASHCSYAIVSPDEDPSFLSIPFGGNRLNEILVRYQGIQYSGAEEYRRNSGLYQHLTEQKEVTRDEEKEVWDEVVKFINTIARYNISYHGNTGKNIDSIYVTGGLLNDKLIASVIKDTSFFMNKPCEFWEPLEKLSNGTDIAPDDKYHYGTALGSALRN